MTCGRRDGVNITRICGHPWTISGKETPWVNGMRGVSWAFVGDQTPRLHAYAYLFFGTAERLREQVRSRIADTDEPPLLRLIRDFHHVVGLDAAAALLVRISKLVVQNGGKLTLSGCRTDLQAAISRAVPGPGADLVPFLDEALEQAEDAVLSRAPQPGTASVSFPQTLARVPSDIARLERLLGTLPLEHLPQGSIVLRAGEQADSLVFLEQGRVVVRLTSSDADGPRLRAMSAGAVLGDIGLAPGTRRKADVIAATAIAIRRLTQAHLMRFEQADPYLALAIQRLLAHALSERIVQDEHRAWAKAGAPR